LANVLQVSILESDVCFGSSGNGLRLLKRFFAMSKDIAGNNTVMKVEDNIVVRLSCSESIECGPIAPWPVAMSLLELNIDDFKYHSAIK
jgi:hypothetical protein